MGGDDKLLQTVDGRPLIARQVHLARSAGLHPVIVALPPRPHPRYAALAGSDAILCEVAQAAEGMNASLRTALKNLPRDARAVMLLLGDLPDLDRNDLLTVLSAVDFSQHYLVWRGATADGQPGHPVVFHRALFSQIAELTGDDGARSVAAHARQATCLIPLPGTHARNDLDTPEDWARWRAQNPHRA